MYVTNFPISIISLFSLLPRIRLIYNIMYCSVVICDNMQHVYKYCLDGIHSLFRWHLPPFSFIIMYYEEKKMCIFKLRLHKLNNCICSLYRGETLSLIHYDRYGDDPSTSCSDRFLWHIEVTIDDTILPLQLRYFWKMDMC